MFRNTCLAFLVLACLSPAARGEDPSRRWLEFFVGDWQRERERILPEGEKVVETARWSCKLAAGRKATITRGKWEESGDQWIEIAGYNPAKLHFIRGTSSSEGEWSLDFKEVDDKKLQGTGTVIYEGQPFTAELMLSMTSPDSFEVSWTAKTDDGQVQSGKVKNRRVTAAESATGQVTSAMPAYIRDFAGRWICETTADMDVEGWFKKGDRIRLEITITPFDDQSGTRNEFSLEYNGVVRGRSHGIVAWDARAGKLCEVLTATGGFMGRGTRAQVEGHWHAENVIIYPDGSTSKSESIETISEDGKTRTVRFQNRRDTAGQPLPDKVEVWKRVGKEAESSDVIPAKARAALRFFVGKWDVESTINGKPMSKTSVTRAWVPGRYAVTVRSRGSENGKPTDGSALCGWDAKGQQIVERWHTLDGITGTIRYPLERMEEDVWYGDFDVIVADGTVAHGKCHLTKTDEGFEWTATWTDNGTQMVRRSVARRTAKTAKDTVRAGKVKNQKANHMVKVAEPTETQNSSGVQAYIRDFAGRWICETTADYDVEGYFKKGDPVRMETVNTPLDDHVGMRSDWLLENGGVVCGRSHAIISWDAAAEMLRELGCATGGFQVQRTLAKGEQGWQRETTVILPDGSTMSTQSVTMISDDGDTHTVRVHNRRDPAGQPLPDKVEVWKRVSKGRELIEQHLGWMVGDWVSEIDVPGEGKVPVLASYRWVAGGEVLQFDLTTGNTQGVNLIVYDASDSTIKMWGANAVGSSGQATLRVEADELVWANRVAEADGRVRPFEFRYVRPAADGTWMVKYPDQVTGEIRQITLRRGG